MSVEILRGNTKGEEVGTKISLPPNEAVKASFPPGCRVLCFDKTGFRVGIVKQVLVSISLSTKWTFGTHYEVSINESLKTGGKGKGGNFSRVFSESSLRFTPGCRVEVTSDYFGSVFRFSGSGGMIHGTVIGCFEVPFSQHTSLKKSNRERDQYFYSVRVQFKGMDESVEAHGVPPEHVRIRMEHGNEQTLSEITGNYNMEVLDCSSLIPKDLQIRRPEDIPIAYSYSLDSEDLEYPVDSESASSREQESYFRLTGGSRRKMISKIRGSMSVGAGVNTSRQRNLNINTPIGGSFRREESRRRSLSPGKNSTRSLSSPSRAFLYKIAPGIKRPPSFDTLLMGHEAQKFKNEGQRQRSESFTVGDGHDGRNLRQQTDVANYLSDDERSDNDEHRHRMQHTIENEKRIESQEIYDQWNEEQQQRHYDENRNEEVILPDSDAKVQNHTNDTSFRKLSPFNNEKKELNDKEHEENESRIHDVLNPKLKIPVVKSLVEDEDQDECVESVSPLEKQNSEKTLTTANLETEIKQVEEIPVTKQNDAILFESPQKLPSPSIPSKPPAEGCYLTYIASSGGYMAIHYSHRIVKEAMGFWFPGPGKNIQAFKFKQNQGRSDIIKNVIGRDFKKKYFSGWCQFVKAARKSNGIVCKWSNKGGIEVDLYVFFKETCEIKPIKNGELCDVSNIDAISCLPAGNSTYDGVRKGEYNKFLNQGQAVGASIAIDGA